MIRFSVSTFFVGLTVLGAGMVSAQDYPNKPVRIITSAVGGGGDFVARLIAQAISGPLGQQVIVDNRGGIISIETVAKAAPDGYTLLSLSNNFWLLPFMQNVSYDPVKDFLPITLTVSAPNVVVVHSSLPVKSVKALIDLAKAKPGELNYAGTAVGSAPHLAAELFKYMAGVNIVRIPYKGAGPAISDLISGQVHLAFFIVTSVMPHIKTGKLRALAVTSARRSALFPDLPTAAATLPGYDAGTIIGMFAPAKTPATIVNQLNQEIVQSLNKADLKERFFNAGIEVVASSPEELAAAIKSDMATMGRLIKDAGIRTE